MQREMSLTFQLTWCQCRDYVHLISFCSRENLNTFQFGSAFVCLGRHPVICVLNSECPLILMACRGFQWGSFLPSEIRQGSHSLQTPLELWEEKEVGESLRAILSLSRSSCRVERKDAGCVEKQMLGLSKGFPGEVPSKCNKKRLVVISGKQLKNNAHLQSFHLEFLGDRKKKSHTAEFYLSLFSKCELDFVKTG